MKKIVLSVIMAAFILTASFAQEKRYGIERAILKKSSVIEMGGMQQTISSTQYIDQYGNKESAESFTDTGGQTITVFTMIKDGYAYNANMTANFGTKTDVAAAAGMDDYKTVNYLNITDDVKERFQIVEKGNEQFLGKDCKRYELDVTVQGQNVKADILVWQGIVLKASMTVAGITMTEETTEIQEGAAIPSEKFELPEGINFIEMPLP